MRASTSIAVSARKLVGAASKRAEMQSAETTSAYFNGRRSRLSIDIWPPATLPDLRAGFELKERISHGQWLHRFGDLARDHEQ
jgi:hypothetical protein